MFLQHRPMARQHCTTVRCKRWQMQSWQGQFASSFSCRRTGQPLAHFITTSTVNTANHLTCDPHLPSRRVAVQYRPLPG